MEVVNKKILRKNCTKEFVITRNEQFDGQQRFYLF